MKVSEVELIPDLSQAQRYKHLSVRSNRNTIKNKIQSGVAKKIGKTRGYTLYMDESGPRGEFSNTRFYAVNDATDLVDLTFDGLQSKTGSFISFEVNTLEGRPGSGLKAHAFYRAVLLALPIIFVSNLQSYGGMRTWQELSKYPDIEVFGWYDNQPVNLDPLDPEETHATDTDAWLMPNDRDIKDDLNRVLNTKLIAHRKIKK